MTSPGPLRDRVTRGAVYMVLRHLFGALVSFAGMVLVARIIGAEQYGYYAGAIGLVTVAQTVCLAGMDVFLIRREGQMELDDYHQAFTLLLVSTSLVASVGLLLAPSYATWNPVAAPVARLTSVMLLALPILGLGVVPQARLERELEFRTVAYIGAFSHSLHPVVAVILAVAGFGMYAPLGGWIVSITAGSVLIFAAARYKPRLMWQPARIRRMVTYGIGYSASTWIWQMRHMVNSMIVGPYAGAAAMAHVGLTLTLIDRLSFVKATSWRLAISALAKVQGDRRRLVAAVQDGMELQVLAVGSVVAVSGVIVPYAVPAVLGHEFAPVATLFPFIAAAALVNTVFSLHSAALYVLHRNRDVALFHAAYVMLLSTSAWMVVPQLGVLGYGAAESIAFVSYLVIYRFMAVRVGNPDCRTAAVWAIGFALVPFWTFVGLWAVVGLALVALWPGTWRSLAGHGKSLQRVVYG